MFFFSRPGLPDECQVLVSAKASFSVQFCPDGKSAFHCPFFEWWNINTISSSELMIIWNKINWTRWKGEVNMHGKGKNILIDPMMGSFDNP